MVAAASKPGEAVFIDTSAWYALFVSTDPKHSEALAIYERLKSNLTQLISTDWILLETSALIHRRVSSQAAHETSMAVLNNPQVFLFWIDDEVGRKAVERFQAAPAGISLVDAGSFALINKLNIRRVFAFDVDFVSQGYHLEE